MKKHRKWIFAALVILLSAGALEIWSGRLHAQRQEREAHFVTLHYLAMEVAADGGNGPAFYKSQLGHGGKEGSSLMKPFPEGIIYQAEGSTFTLAEPRARHVSLWKKDRLICTEREWPHWEASGEIAHK